MKDPQDAYAFVYPFGWQEVAVKGQDIVFKDVIEPLESVSVSITQTDKADVTEFGTPAEVCASCLNRQPSISRIIMTCWELRCGWHCPFPMLPQQATPNK